MTRTVPAIFSAAVGAALLAGCGSSTPAASSASTPATESATSQGTLTVFAAASLKKTFTEIGTEFEAAHPGTTVTFNFAGSSDLVTQLQQGAPADVFASADTANMRKATDDNLIEGTPADFATNTLQIAVPPGNPAKVASLQDLAKPEVKVVVCAPQVPCGAAAEKVETAGHITITPVSEESSVTDVLNKVQTGEADAGLVYVTDVKGAGDKVTGVTFPESSSAVNVYPIGVAAGTKNTALATQFTEFVTGPQGRKVLADAGFGSA